MKDGYKILDTHNHYYAKPWLDYVAKRTEDPKYEWQSDHVGVFYVSGVIAAHVDKKGTFDVDSRVEEMDNYGIDMQLMTHTCPGLGEVEVEVQREFAPLLNDLYASYEKKYPDRFRWMCTLPFDDMDASLKEMDRARGMGAVGVQVYSNVNGQLVSAPQFHPIWEKAASFDWPVFVHPAFTPLTKDAMIQAGVPLQLYGFLMDTTLVATSMIFQGMFDKIPNCKMYHGHLGGMAPYMVGRADNAFRGFAKEWGFNVDRLPSEVYREHVWIDTLSCHVPAIHCAVEYMPDDHVTFGTDYPHRASGTVEMNMDIVMNQTGLTDEQKKLILWENAAKLWKIEE